jgi:hypothetical protein
LCRECSKLDREELEYRQGIANIYLGKSRCSRVVPRSSANVAHRCEPCTTRGEVALHAS